MTDSRTRRLFSSRARRGKHGKDEDVEIVEFDSADDDNDDLWELEHSMVWSFPSTVSSYPVSYTHLTLPTKA